MRKPVVSRTLTLTEGIILVADSETRAMVETEFHLVDNFKNNDEILRAMRRYYKALDMDKRYTPIRVVTKTTVTTRRSMTVQDFYDKSKPM